MRSLIPWLVLALALLLTLASTLEIAAGIRERDRDRFENAVQSAQDRIRTRMDTYLGMLYGASALFSGARAVERAEFRSYVARLEVQRRYPGIQGIGFTRRVRPGELAGFEAAVRAGGEAGFRVWPAGPRAEYHAIVFLEPEDRRNQAAIGYDMFTDATRRAAMARARDGGEPAMTGRVTLVQEIDRQKQAGFLIYVPVYEADRVPAGVEARRRELEGFVYAPFRAADLFNGIFGSERAPRVSFQVYAGAVPRPDALLYDHGLPLSGRHAPLTDTVVLRMAGQPWTLVFSPSAAFGAGSREPLAWVVGLTGLLLSWALFALTRTQVRGRALAERHAHEVEQMAHQLQEQAAELEHQVETAQALTEELEASNEELLASTEEAETARQEAERERARATDVLESITDAAFAVDGEWRTTYVNGAFERLTGHRREALLGCNWWEAFPEAVGTRFYQEYHRALRERVPVALEEYYSPRGLWYDIRAYPTAEGGLAVYFRDVSARRRADAERARLVEALETERARLAAIVEHAPVGIVIAEAPSGRILLGNPMAERILRHPVRLSADVGAYAEWVAFHPDGRRVQGEEYPLARALATGEIAGPDEYLYQRGDGTVGWVQITGAPIRDAEGRVVAALVLVDDIDAEKQASQERERLLHAVEMERSRLRGIFQKAPAFIAVLRGPEHVFEMANPHYYQLVGHREVLGRSVREALPEVAGQGFFELLDGVYRTAQPYAGTEMAILLQREPGAVPEERYVNFVYQPLVEADGAVSGIFVHGVDVSDQVRARQAVEEASRAKSDFLATMSHELRTPLNAMIGYSELLLMGVPETIPPRSQEQVDRIRLSARHLLQIIEEILTFSRLEVGRERVDAEAVSVAEIAREVTAIIEPLAAARGLGFEITVPTEPLGMRTDPRKLRQILLNLLGNAIKFTEAGRITFSVWREGEAACFRVTDTGIGIAPEHRERIFEAFWQAETTIHARVGGTGLGLPVTRQLAELLGGTVTLESTVGEGSAFTVRLPLDAPAPQPRESTAQVG